MWSVGVVLYILLCGFPPFYAEEEEKLLQIVRRGHFEFSSPYWDGVSPEAKALVRQCLHLDPARRPTPHQALHCPWMTASAAREASAPPAAAPPPPTAPPTTAKPGGARGGAVAPTKEAEMLLRIRALRERCATPRAGRPRASFQMQLGAADRPPSFSAAPTKADLAVQGARFVTLPRALFDELYALCDAQRQGGEAGVGEEMRQQFAELMQTVSLQASQGELGKVG